MKFFYKTIAFHFFLLLFLLTLLGCLLSFLLHTCISFSSCSSQKVSLNWQEQLNSIYANDEKVAFLTFDDGPTKIATPKILDILKKQNIHATFFVIGYRVKEFPEIVKRAYEEGNFIANHSYSHQNKQLYASKQNFIQEIQNTDLAISEAIGVSHYTSHIFRFPNGYSSPSFAYEKKLAREYLQEIDYAYIDWNALNYDSEKLYSKEELLANLKKTCKNKTTLVILMHDTTDVSKSYEVLEDSILFLKEQGYTFKTFFDFIS